MLPTWKPFLFLSPPGSLHSLFNELPEQKSQQKRTLENHFLVYKSASAYAVSLNLHKEPRDINITIVLNL